MAEFIENRPIYCSCGYGPNHGQESSQKDRWGNIVHECRWTCARCLSLIRVDEKIEKKAKKDYDGDGTVESPEQEWKDSKTKAIAKSKTKKKD